MFDNTGPEVGTPILHPHAETSIGARHPPTAMIAAGKFMQQLKMKLDR